MIQPNRIKHPHAMRYALLEALIEWHEFITPEIIAKILNVSQGHAGRVMRAYLVENPGGWEYNTADRVWNVSDTYVREFLELKENHIVYIARYCELTGQSEGDMAWHFQE